MCGIFGITAIKDNSQTDFSLLKHDIDILTKKSELRGSDTFGVLIKDQLTNSIFKINENPSSALKRKDYKNFLNKKLKKELDYVSIIGQTRLVTNGSKFSENNNQPILTDNIIGVHNGIFVDFEEDKLSNKTKNYESNSIKSDSLQFFEMLSDISFENNISNNFINTVNKIKGNYSIAFTFKEYDQVLLSSNCGSLFYYYDKKNNFFAFASEKKILIDYINESKFVKNKKINLNLDYVKQCFDKIVIFNPLKNELKIIDNKNMKNDFNYKLFKINKDQKIKTTTNFEDNLYRHSKLKRCNNCILPETYPYIKFDNDGVCNFCRSYKKQIYYGEKKLLEILDKHRSKNGEPDCIVGLSGGRDSCYALHLMKTKYKMNPIAYTFDWGLTTDISRINASKMCGQLGIEQIIRSADLEKRRSHIRANIFAWLKRPHLGMVPMFQAGDKGFYKYGRDLSKELNLKLAIHGTGHQLEQREFFLGFIGVNEKLKNNPTLSHYGLYNKINVFFRYSFQYLLNLSYFNSSSFYNLKSFWDSFIMKDNTLHLYRYEKWDEKKIIKTLTEEYDWKSDISYGNNQWRMGDGQTAFNNFIYYTVAGFSEYDNFRSNQIREGLITRSEGFNLAEQDNKIKYDTLKIFSELIGFNLDLVLSKINCIPRLY